MIIILIVGCILVAFYIYNIRCFSYWSKKGVKHDRPVFIFGNNAKNYLMQQSRSQSVEEMYNKYPDEKIVGFYRSTSPELIIRDPELVKKVLISDFPSFYVRGFHPFEEKIEPLMRNLFFVSGDLWKMLRHRITSAFTSGKLKAMFPLITERAEKLQSRTLEAAKTSKTINARDLFSRYTIDFIGSCGFGLDGSSLTDDNCEFGKLGRDLFNFTFKDIVTASLKTMFPRLCQDLKFFGRFEPRVFSLVNQVQASRGYKPSGRHDFFDQLLEYKQKGPIDMESMEKFNPDGTPVRVSMSIDDGLIASQTILFFAAGFETSSSASSFLLHELAFNPDIQKKVQDEIDAVLAKYDNKLCFDAIKDMKYLECAFKEGMRIFPSVGYLMRECSRKYTFDELNFTIDKGVKVYISAQALHMDPKYWDKPEQFRPERFHPDEFNAIQKVIYLPFGEGPRNCIGARLGLMQSLAGLAAILSKFTVEPAPETIRKPVVLKTSDLVQGVVGGLPLIFKERKIVQD